MNNGTSGLARPRGKYPHSVRRGNLIFVSGTSARQADDSIPGVSTDSSGTTHLSIEAQTSSVIDALESILSAHGLGLDALVQVTSYLVSMNDFSGYNAVWNHRFELNAPCRTTVAVHQLPHPHLLIEMQAIAVIPEDT